MMSLTMCIFAPVSASHVSGVQKVPVKKAPKTCLEQLNFPIPDSLVLAPPNSRNLLHDTTLRVCGEQSAGFA
jgi:hypothetical protein